MQYISTVHGWILLNQSQCTVSSGKFLFLSVTFTDWFALGQSDVRISVAYNSLLVKITDKKRRQEASGLEGCHWAINSLFYLVCEIFIQCQFFFWEWYTNGLENDIDVPLCIHVAVKDDYISVRTSFVMPRYLTSLTQSSWCNHSFILKREFCQRYVVDMISLSSVMLYFTFLCNMIVNTV